MKKIHRIIFISFLVLILGKNSKSASAKPSSVNFKVKDKEFFITKDAKATWSDAFDYCRGKGLKLASVTSQAENDEIVSQLKSLAGSRDFFWTSGNDIAVYDDYWWDSIGERFTYTNWMKGQPNHITNGLTGQTQHCVIYEMPDNDNTFQWDDAMCDDVNYIICNS